MTNVLLAIDGNFYGKVISDFVVNHHWAPNTQFKLIHVIDPSSDDVYTEAQWEREEQAESKELLEEVAVRIQKVLPETNVSQFIRHGEPRAEILKEAEEWPAHLIVLGSHGRRSHANRSSLGSVSLSVLSQAQSTVILVRVPQRKIEALAAEAEKSSSH